MRANRLSSFKRRRQRRGIDRAVAICLAVLDHGWFATAPAMAWEAAGDLLRRLLPDEVKTPGRFIFHSPTAASSWSFGVYGGQLNNNVFARIAPAPWKARDTFEPAYLVAANGVYRAVEFPYLPIDFEIDVTAGYHFGPQEFAEFTLTPTLRWKWFPWNHYVYTTLRGSPVGLSFTTAESRLEALETVGRRTSKLLNSLVYEWTFAPSETSNWEAFYRIHHRCGAYGLFDGVVGGSNYMSLGLRARF